MYFNPPYQANVLSSNCWVPIDIKSEKELKLFRKEMKDEIYVVTCTHKELYLTND